MLELYGVPTVPVVLDTHCAVNGGAIVIPQLVVAVPATEFVESFTWAVNVNGPAVVGVPVIAPVEASRLNPVGRPPDVIENVYGGTPPLATSVELYGTPTWPVLSAHSKLIGGGVVTTIEQLLVVILAEPSDESITCAVNEDVPG